MNYQQQPGNFQGQPGYQGQAANYPQQPMRLAVQRQCFKCNYDAVSADEVCPRCRCPKFLTAGNIRTRGGVLIGLGLFIAGLIGGIAIFVGIMIYGQALKDPETARKISEESHIWLTVILLFGALIMLGLHWVISGMWMLAFGKRNRLTVWVMWILIAIVFGLGAMFRFLT